MKTSIYFAAATVALAACNGGNSGQTSDATEDSLVTPSLTQTWKTDSVFTGSESTLYDTQADVIYVSNGNTKPGEKDGDGFISTIKPDGTVNELKWVAEDLHAPKGMALLSGKLYVTDIDELKVIDVATATVENTIAVDSAVFLNDVATDGQLVYFSDSRTGKVYAYTPGDDNTYQVISSTNPNVNGLACHSGHLYALDGEGLKKFSNDGDYTQETLHPEMTGGDGLVILNDTTFVASRWHGEIFLIRGSEMLPLLDTRAEESNTADIGFVPGKNLVIVPTFMKNEVAAFELTY